MKKCTSIGRLAAFIIALLSAITISAQSKVKDWTAFSQKIDITTSKKIKFKITASVKANTENKNSHAALWARVDNKKKKTGFFDNMSNRPITINSWNTYTIEGILDKNALQLYFGGIASGNGSFMFDNFKLFIENADTNKFEEIPINNGSFEKQLDINKVVGWGMAVSINQGEKTNGFSGSISIDAADGKSALLIRGEDVKKMDSNYIGPLEGYSQQIGTLITMLNNLKERIEYTVVDLSQAELDFIIDEEANSIGALLAHLIATEKLYQIITFEQRDPSGDEMSILNDAMELGDEGRKNLKGIDVKKYLEAFTEARLKTMELLKEKDDEWLAKIPNGSSVSNFFSWFHVMEHQSSHLGQILLLKKRIPENVDLQLQAPKKID